MSEPLKNIKNSLVHTPLATVNSVLKGGMWEKFFTVNSVNVTFIKDFLNLIWFKLNSWSISLSIWYLTVCENIFVRDLQYIRRLAHAKRQLVFVDVLHIRYLNKLLFLFIIYMSVLYFTTYNISSLHSLYSFSELNSAVFSHLDEVEEECGQTEDLVTFFSFFLVCILWFYLFNIFAGSILLNSMNWILLVFWFLLIMGIVIPTGVFKKMGISCVQYVRGSSRSSTLLVESLLDLVSLTVIVLRFFLQNIRFVFIFFGFLEYYEFVSEKLLFNNNFFSFFFKNININSLNSNLFIKINYFVEFFSQTILYLYYVGHLTIVYIAQLSIYIALSFWIFFFFYFTFVLARFPNYFKYRRLGLPNQNLN